MKKKEYLNNSQLQKLGFYKIGKNNKISNSLKTFNFSGELGSNNRIDENVILKGNIILNNNIHIARDCTLSASKLYKIYIGNFVSLSNFVQVFCISDNYKTISLSGGTLSQKERSKFSKSYCGDININNGCIIGPFSIILPDTNIGEFTTISPYTVIYGKIDKGIFILNKKKTKRKYSKLKKLYNSYYKK